MVIIERSKISGQIVEPKGRNFYPTISLFIFPKNIEVKGVDGNMIIIKIKLSYGRI